MKRIYITTAIPYVNAAPHVGHALELVQSDAVVRFYKALGLDVFWSWGADENSLKNVQAAEAEGVSVQKLVDKYAKQFGQLGEALNLTFDVFNRTSSKRHFEGAQKLWQLCKKEDIYKKKYRGLYCVGCEAFYMPNEINDGKCPEGHVNIEEVEEENYFFALSKYQKYLETLISTDKLQIMPNSRKNEVLAFIKSGLEDFSISRSVERARGWGVPVPFVADAPQGKPIDPSTHSNNSVQASSGQVMYVWFDALTTYLTALGYPKSDLYQKYWIDPSTHSDDSVQASSGLRRIHIIGKGIIRFHAVYWPAMLASAGIPLPNTEFVHGYITVEGQKISKSVGNVIDPFDLQSRFGTDPLRYYLLREIPAWGDGDFSQKRFVDLYNGELANGLGNLVARVARLAADTNLVLPPKKHFKFKKAVADNLKIYRFDQALIALWEDISNLDKIINEERPWELEGRTLKRIIGPISSEIREIAFNLSPFLPQTSEKILDQFTGKIEAGKPLFPRI